MGGIALTRDVTQAALAGLSEAEAARRLEAGEGNERQATAGRSYARIVLGATFLPINLVLIVVAGVRLAVGLPIDAGLTASPVQRPATSTSTCSGVPPACRSKTRWKASAPRLRRRERLRRASPIANRSDGHLSEILDASIT